MCIRVCMSGGFFISAEIFARFLSRRRARVYSAWLRVMYTRVCCLIDTPRNIFRYYIFKVSLFWRTLRIYV